MIEKYQFSRDVAEEDIKFSIIIPAHNEENYIEKCLDSIVKASELYKGQVEVIVVLNLCTDRTGEIAQSYKKELTKNLQMKHITIIKVGNVKYVGRARPALALRSRI